MVTYMLRDIFRTRFALLASLTMFIGLAVICTVSTTASASTSSVSNSSNYGVSEVQFGSGGELHACSTSYCSKQSLGEIGVGNSASTSYQTQGGDNTEREPFLAVDVTGSGVDLGYVTSSSAASGSTTFNVSSYLASGYVVVIEGLPLKNNGVSGYTIPYMAAAATSTPGTEQFGINLRQNTSPAVGADVVQVPSSTFSFGGPATGYGTVNNFKYANGDTIASSTKSSGETDYTLSMILNVATTTPGGQYKGRIGINAIPTF